MRQVQTHGLKAKVKDIGEAARVGRGNPSKIFNKQLLDEVFCDIQNYEGRDKCYQSKMFKIAKNVLGDRAPPDSLL